ncbi:MAG TPA: hypothetical protein VGX23_32350 [Actinocrinis sp.]|nr:hypothetical protein [Actinocrinis sp.]
MSADTRRSAGTQSGTDGILRALHIKRLSPAQDLADYSHGVTLQVMCFLRQTNGLAGGTRFGRLHLASGQPVVWRQRNGAGEFELHQPFSLTPVEQRTGHWKVGAYALESSAGSFIAMIPKIDVPLVEHAFAHAPQVPA